MGIMTGQTITAGHRGMDIGFREIGLVVALKTKFGDRSRKRQLTFFLRMRGRMAGRATLFHAGILLERGVDDPLRCHFFVAVDAGLLRCTGTRGKRGKNTGDEHGSVC